MKGVAIGILMLLVLSVIVLIISITYGLSFGGTFLYGNCYQKTIDQLKGLQKGENNIDIDEKCVESVVITPPDNVNKFGCSISNPEKYESVFVVFPVEPPSGWEYFKDPVVTWQGRNRVIKCIGNDFFPLKGEIVLNSRGSECLYIEYKAVNGKDTIREC